MTRAYYNEFDPYVAQWLRNLTTAGPTGPVNGFWSDVDWLYCRDGKWRPVEPGSFPLASGAPARVGRLRVDGVTIGAQASIAFITSYMECRP